MELFFLLIGISIGIFLDKQRLEERVRQAQKKVNEVVKRKKVKLTSVKFKG